MLRKINRFILDNKIIVVIALAAITILGISTLPFKYSIPFIPSNPVPVDAIPDLGENQQIVFTEWPGRSPHDVEDQITYPLTSVLLGIPGVKSVRSHSMFGMSSIYLIFDEEVEFYWSRSRILEKLNSLPANTLPEEVKPGLGPDATALGQIFWYTLEGQDESGNTTGGWDLHELRSVQDYYVKFALTGTSGVAEVASVGGYVKEYQVDMDPEAMKSYGISMNQMIEAIRETNRDVGANTIEINQVEYFVRGLGYVKSIEDIEKTVVKVVDNLPVTLGEVARVNIGPAARRGILDKSGAEVAGGVVVARYGSNPMAVIRAVKEKINEIEAGLPSKVLEDGTVSQVKIVPFYDRGELIDETIGTLDEALRLEILVCIIVVILLLLNIQSSVIVSLSIPLSVLLTFVAMKYFGIDANIVALSGIAIAIGTMGDMAIIVVESIVHRRETYGESEPLLSSIRIATEEVAGAVMTAIVTTVISFLPVFTLEAAEGKLFRPLAFTKTFALLASILITIFIIPTVSYWIYLLRSDRPISRYVTPVSLTAIGFLSLLLGYELIGWVLVTLGVFNLLLVLARRLYPEKKEIRWKWMQSILYAVAGIILLAYVWMPLGVEKSTLINGLFLMIIIGSLMSMLYLVLIFYEEILRFVLQYRWGFLSLVFLLVIAGVRIMQNTGKEFMPALDEGAFLLMPTSMPHSGVEENLKNLQLLDMAVTSIPEVESVVGKAGRVDSPLDPAPVSMYENVINYKPEYKTNEKGYRVRYKTDENGDFVRDWNGELIEDPKGQYFRNWRPEIRSPDDIWEEIVKVSKLPGVTSAPKLQPIETRLVMLQTGMRAPMGIKIQGNDLETIEAFGIQLEPLLRETEGVKASAVFADRIIGKPYLVIDIDRSEIARHGLSVGEVQNYIQSGIGGAAITKTVEGRERYDIRIRLPRTWRDSPEKLEQILISTPAGSEIPLGEVASIRYEQGPMEIKSEDGFLVGYVLFDRESEYPEGEVVENAQKTIKEAISEGRITVPSSIHYYFAGNYEQQIRANNRLALVIPVALILIMLILYFHFRSFVVTSMVFSGVLVAFAGGFIMIWLYGQDWFLNFSMFGANLRDVFQIRGINLSVAVWVGFLALAGIATDDGVLMATFIQSYSKEMKPATTEEVREVVVQGGLRRVRPAVLTTATTILALLPVLSSTGRGSDIMVPMAIPSFGGMVLQVVTMFTVPVMYFMFLNRKIKRDERKK